MSDLYIDFRKKSERRTAAAIDFFRYYNDIQAQVLDFDSFSLVLSTVDDLNNWGPYESPDKKVFIALSGRVAFEDEEWCAAGKICGNGGLACKRLYDLYQAKKLSGLYDLNGSFVAIIYDRSIGHFHIILDRCGMSPFFSTQTDNGDHVFTSHADLLPRIVDGASQFDLTSMAEFLITGKVMFPNSYYERVKALESGCSYTLDVNGYPPSIIEKKRYFCFRFNTDHCLTRTELAEELKIAFGRAVRRRTGDRFGQTAISLSGGLDSRALLFSSNRKGSLWAFCFYDAENLEFNVAKEVAQAAGARFIPLKRDYEYYGNHAEMGVRISGGTGNIFNNHYLGFRSKIKSLGIDNIIAGFYCDRFFKGYVLNREVSRFFRTEKLTDFKYENNQRFIWPNSEYAAGVRARLEQSYNIEMRRDNSDQGRLRVEQKRIFPLYSESENPTTIIPQRVMGWFLPSIDNDIIDVYLKTPIKYKLHPSMYSQMVEMVCGEEASNIMNVSTGAKVNPSRLNLFIGTYRRAIQRRFYRLRGCMATDESWPNWLHYIHNSKQIEVLWMRERKKTQDILSQILGTNPYACRIGQYKEKNLDLFLRLLTLKIWLELNM